MCGATPLGRLVLPDDLTATGLARRFLTQVHCPAHGHHDRDAAALIVSELVSNALRHAQPPVELEIDCAGTELRLRVRDADPAGPPSYQAHQAGPDDEGGRGLDLVQAVSTSWGVTQHGRGKSVWARLPIPDSAAAS